MKPAFGLQLNLAMELGESPLWHPGERALYWVDILGGELHRYDPEHARHEVMPQGEAITCIARSADGGLVAALRSGVWRLDSSGYKARRLAPAPEDIRDHRFNDGGCDPAGRFWIGTMNETLKVADAALYCHDGHALRRVLSGLTISNGVAFSPDARWLYHTDTPTRRIQRYPFDAAAGTVGEGEVWVDLADHGLDGNPDGAAVDAAGHYWTALFGGAAVARFDPDGRLAGHYPVDALQPTMPAFGGPDRRTLYLTTAREHMSRASLAEWPLSGALFAMRVETPGQPVAAFRPQET